MTGPLWFNYASGPLAQLVAHLHDTQGVRGSSPLRPTDRDGARAASSIEGSEERRSPRTSSSSGERLHKPALPLFAGSEVIGPPATTSRRPLASIEAATYSEPNLAKRSRYSTMMVESDKSPGNLWRLPLGPEPTSVTTRSIEWPLIVAHVVTRAT